MKKYLNPINYLNKLQWLPIFNRVYDSEIGANCRIHRSSIIQDSKLKEKVNVFKGNTVLNSEIGYFCRLLENNYLFKTKFGDYSYSNVSTTLLRSDVGKFCSIGPNVFVGPTSHPLDRITTHPFTFFQDYGGLIKEDDSAVISNRESIRTVIGHDVWIGQGAVIMPGIVVDDGAVIGSHSVVTKDVKPFSIVVGVPAKHIKYRFDEDQRNKLLQLKWWDWDRALLFDRVKEFNSIDGFIKKYC